MLLFTPMVVQSEMSRRIFHLWLVSCMCRKSSTFMKHWDCNVSLQYIEKEKCVPEHNILHSCDVQIHLETKK
jgi:hypothetical protein